VGIVGFSRSGALSAMSEVHETFGSEAAAVVDGVRRDGIAASAVLLSALPGSTGSVRSTAGIGEYGYHPGVDADSLPERIGTTLPAESGVIDRHAGV